MDSKTIFGSTAPIDFALLLDESGSMKKPKPVGSLEGPNGAKAFARKLVDMFTPLSINGSRFSVVSFAENATTRVPWSYNQSQINDGIDDLEADDLRRL